MEPRNNDHIDAFARGQLQEMDERLNAISRRLDDGLRELSKDISTGLKNNSDDLAKHKDMCRLSQGALLTLILTAVGVIIAYLEMRHGY